MTMVHAAVEIAPASGGSQVAATVKGDPGGLMKMLGPILDRIVKKNITADHGRLKALLEEE